MIVPLGGGQTATIRDRLTYAQARAVRAALQAVGTDQAALLDLDIALVRAYVESWSVLGLDGSALPVDRAEDAPDELIQAIAVAAMAAWNGRADPNPSAGPSPTTSPGAQ